MRFDFLTAVLIKVKLFRDMTPCRLVNKLLIFRSSVVPPSVELSKRTRDLRGLLDPEGGGITSQNIAVFLRCKTYFTCFSGWVQNLITKAEGEIQTQGN